MDVCFRCKADSRRCKEVDGGFLNIRNVAKCAARMGQCFSSSTPTLEVQKYEVDEIPDIEREDEFGMGKYCFSDGIGKISKEFATEVAKKYGAKNKNLSPGMVPSAFRSGMEGIRVWWQWIHTRRPNFRYAQVCENSIQSM